jgi:hypothetical protein
MPGINFDVVRAEIRMQRVLEAIGFEPTSQRGSQWRGRCPVHGAQSARSLTFSVNVETGRYRCHKCRSEGNQLELWAAAHNLKLYDAVIDLCRALGREVPWVKRW